MKRDDGRSISRDALENYRFQALKLRKNGWRVTKIAEAFGLHVKSISRWFVKASKHGEQSLKKTKAKGAKPKLSIKEKTEIINCLKESAMDFGFETPLWTAKRVQQLIIKKHNIKIHISKICDWLKKIGLSPQKPKKNPPQRNEKLVKRWIKNEWPKINEHRRKWQAILYFIDEAGISLIPYVGRTWAPKGKTPTINVTGNRGGFCVSSGITPAGKLIFRIEKGKVNSNSHLDFLQKIIKQHPKRKVIVVADNASSHKSNLIRGFVESNKQRFALYHIPPYSPDLNPDEHIWSYLKAYELKAHQAQTVSELKKLTNKKMQKIQRNANLIKSFFMKNKVA